MFGISTVRDQPYIVRLENYGHSSILHFSATRPKSAHLKKQGGSDQQYLLTTSIDSWCTGYGRSAQIPGNRTPGRQNFVRWRLILVSSVWNLLHVTQMAPRIWRGLLHSNAHFNVSLWWHIISANNAWVTSEIPTWRPYGAQGKGNTTAT